MFNQQKLDYDLVNSTSLESFFNGIKQHTNKLNPIALEINQLEIDPDTELFANLIDMLSEMKSSVNNALVRFTTFKLKNIQNNHPILSIKLDYNSYIDTLLSVGSDDDVIEAIASLLVLRTILDKNFRFNQVDIDQKLNKLRDKLLKRKEQLQENDIAIANAKASQDQILLSDNEEPNEGLDDEEFDEEPDNEEPDNEEPDNEEPDEEPDNKDNEVAKDDNLVQDSPDIGELEPNTNKPSQDDNKTDMSDPDTIATDAINQTQGLNSTTEVTTNEDDHKLATESAPDIDNTDKPISDTNDDFFKDMNDSINEETSANTNVNADEVSDNDTLDDVADNDSLLQAVSDNHDGDDVEDEPISNQSSASSSNVSTDLSDLASKVTQLLSDVVTQNNQQSTEKEKQISPLDSFLKKQDSTIAANLANVL